MQKGYCVCLVDFFLVCFLVLLDWFLFYICLIVIFCILLVFVMYLFDWVLFFCFFTFFGIFDFYLGNFYVETFKLISNDRKSSND